MLPVLPVYLLSKECLAISLNNDVKLSTLCWHTLNSGGAIVQVMNKIPYKMKYWQGVNFDNWQLLDKISNV